MTFGDTTSAVFLRFSPYSSPARHTDRHKHNQGFLMMYGQRTPRDIRK